MKIVEKFLPEHCYMKVNTKKKHICLHHTVSNPISQDGDIATWSATKNIATTYIICGSGSVLKVIPDNFWAHHLGTKFANNTQLNQETIGIEIDAWGPVSKVNNQWHSVYNKAIDKNLSIEILPKAFRGYLYFQEYLPAQIESLRVLLLMLSKEHDIPLVGLNKHLNFEFLPQVELNKPGIFSHSNYRQDKSDIYPSSKLITMLKTL